jgi:hypothetical protein
MSGNMAHSEVNPDLLKERRAATFSVERLTNFLDGGENMTQRRREIRTRALQEKVGLQKIACY